VGRATRRALRESVARGAPRPAAAPGSRLVRVWRGTTHVVSVGEDGVIRWNNREWRSLSEIARAITDTRWSGPAFFGLRSKREAA
jgi:hypothetical protein